MIVRSDVVLCGSLVHEEAPMAKGNNSQKKETKKPKKESNKDSKKGSKKK